ncbi:nuclear transport factor 2 family protein [Erythrobacter rubeus]|uniref:Nuclear transport factor 2 family protein n=1 Tax=Erythrobacter rubeus TaxID=2760803 RepID=A0ABR8KVI8_9SPHN|nr:nuclear transport factor 2 family protein [Erythrobacter rubeus]MBD2842262.1 nuclear transport factor 2 family protein [Erythrobacter rubeus]
MAAGEQIEESAADRADEARMNAAAKVVQRSIDAYRARNLDRWLAQFSPDVLVVVNGYANVGHRQLRETFETAVELGLPDPVILDSGWTGERVYLTVREFLPDGTPIQSYSEYVVENGKITEVYGRI